MTESPQTQDLPLPQAAVKRAKSRLGATWLKWTVMAGSLFLPANLLIGLCWRNIAVLKDDFPAATAVTLAILALSLLLLYAAIENFDPGSLRPFLFGTIFGYVLKLLACLHGLIAIYLLCQMHKDATVLDLPEGVVLLLCGYAWLTGALAYLVGDVQLRQRRD